jgi:hypothetical protein
MKARNQCVALPYLCEQALKAAEQYMNEGERNRLKKMIQYVQTHGVPCPRTENA